MNECGSLGLNFSFSSTSFVLSFTISITCTKMYMHLNTMFYLIGFRWSYSTIASLLMIEQHEGKDRIVITTNGTCLLSVEIRKRSDCDYDKRNMSIVSRNVLVMALWMIFNIFFFRIWHAITFFNFSEMQ
jgi:hypothetical protein